MHLPWTSAAPVRGGKTLESLRSGGLPCAFSSRAVVRALPSSHGHGSAHHPRRHAAGFPARYQSYTSSPSHHSLDMIGAEKNIFDISSMPTFAQCSPETEEAMPMVRSDGTAVLMELPHAYGHGGSMHFPANNAVPMQRMGAPTAAAAAAGPATPHAVNGTGSQSRSADQALHHVQQCAITHPGSITCTSAAVQLDPETGTVVLSLKATVRRTEQCSVSTLDLEELGWLALERSAAQRAASVKQMTLADTPGEAEQRHRTIVDLLTNGVVIDAEKRSNDFGHISYLVTLEHPHTQQRCKALFKPRMEGDGEGWHRVPIEAAAYQLNLLLGMDYVPPAVFRRTCDVDWNHFEEGGTFIYWCGTAQDLKSVRMDSWGCRSDVLLSDTRILDVLIQNSDRHAGHFLWADHWAKGHYRGGRANMDAWKGRKYPVLIDQAAGFRPEAFVCLDHQNAFSTGPTRHISAKTYMRLRFLDHATAAAALSEFITPSELQAMLSRKDNILAYFDRLVQDQGYRSVVLEDTSDVATRVEAPAAAAGVAA